jgi:hypothetical protein
LARTIQQRLTIRALSAAAYWLKVDVNAHVGAIFSLLIQACGPDRLPRKPVRSRSQLCVIDVYLYAPYSLAVSTMALMFSGLASSKNAPLLTI